MLALHPPSGVGRLLAVTLLVVAVIAGPGAASANATFAESVVAEEYGDVASIPLVLSGTDEATVTVERSDGTFEATLAVTDTDGDGRVTVQFNTYLAGRNATRAFGTAGEDEVSVVNATRANGANATGDYELSVVGASNPEGPDDVATLLVNDRRAESLAAWVAPRELADDLASPAAIERYRRKGTLTNGSVLRDNLLVLRLRASGLEGVLAAQEGNATERFVSMLETERPNLTVEQTNPTPELPAKELLLNDTGAVSIVPDARNDTYYLVVDVAHVRVDPDAYGSRDPSEHWLRLHEGEEFQAFFAFHGTPSPWNADERPEVVMSRRFELTQRHAEIETPGEFGPLFLRPEPDREIVGRTNLDPGERLRVVVHAPNGAFDRVKRVVVAEDRRFRTSVNLSGVPDGTELRIDVRYENRSLLDEPARAVVDLPDAAVEIVGYDVNGSYYGVEVNATVSRSGFVVLHRGAADGPILDVSDYLSPGTHSWKTVPLSDPPAGNVTIVAVVHRDADGDRSFDAGSDQPYATNGTHLSDSRTIRFPDWGTTSTTATTDPTTGQTPTTTDGQPGFGAVATLFAILALVALARRRP